MGSLDSHKHVWLLYVCLIDLTCLNHIKIECCCITTLCCGAQLVWCLRTVTTNSIEARSITTASHFLHWLPKCKSVQKGQMGLGLSLSHPDYLFYSCLQLVSWTQKKTFLWPEKRKQVEELQLLLTPNVRHQSIFWYGCSWRFFHLFCLFFFAC